ncbi:hypothetical protein [Streptomyces cellostaticus]|uniref:hypothetical protein n=1 Tax=Streptomyces cellostaticus TaxID=67285 RepID=UPI0020260600|nr:hypothetical protein [Streptomyces cellostaticus]
MTRKPYRPAARAVLVAPEIVTAVVASVHDAFALRIPRAPRVGTGLDQDAVLLDLLSLRPSSRRIRRSNNDPVNVRRSFAPPATIGVVGATSPFAVRGPQAPPRTELSAMTEPAPEMLDLVADRPLTALADIAFARLDTFAAWDPATEAPPELVFLRAEGADIKARLAPLVDSDSAGVLYALGVPIVASGIIAGFFAGFVGSELWQDPDMVDRWRAILGRLRSLAEDVVFLEEQAELDLPLVERLLCECLDTAAHRLDAWVTSLATARLAATRDQPSGLRTGAYGWLVDVAPAEPAHRIASDGYLVAPSLHHATTAAVLRSGWLAHSNQDAFAVNLTSRRVRSALALLDGVRSGQDLAALLAAREALGSGRSAARSCCVLATDAVTGTGSTATPDPHSLAGLVVDAWTESVPWEGREPGTAEEVAAFAFHAARPGARAPQALLLAVPPDRSRGWRMQDVHAVIEETFDLARIRALDLIDLPEMRGPLPLEQPFMVGFGEL